MRNYDESGNQNYFRGTGNREKKNNRTNTNVDVEADFDNDIDNRADADSESNVRNTDKNTNIARTTVSNSGNSRVDIRLKTTEVLHTCSDRYRIKIMIKITTLM